MDIVRFMGGLGNQMFQYAFLRSLEEKKKTSVLADVSFYSNNPDARKFILDQAFSNLKLTTCNNYEGLQRIYKENQVHQYDLEVYERGDCIYDGYWQSYKYFEFFADKIRSEFAFCIEDEMIERFSNDLNGGIYASIHIRLGDYKQSAHLYGNICTSEYYKNAVKYVKDRIPQVKFVLFSDEMEEAKRICESLEINPIIINCETNNSNGIWTDMYLMSKCMINIIANSSYSWWGAYLNSQKQPLVIAPIRWLNDRECPDIVPPEWVRL